MNDFLTDRAQDMRLEDEDDYLFFDNEFMFYVSNHFIESYLTSTFLILALLVVYFSTVLVCYVIHKFEILRTRTNYILANYFISTSIFGTLAIFNQILVTFQYGHIATIYFVVGVKYAFYMTTVLIIMLLAFDWYTSVNWPIIFLKWQKSYKWIIAACYLPCAGFVILYFTYSQKTDLIGEVIVGTLVLHFTALVVAIIISIHKKRQMYKIDELKTFYAFASAELCMFVWSFYWISTIGLSLFSLLMGPSQQYAINVIEYICKFFYCFGVASLGLCLFFLKRWDKHFSMTFEYTFKRSMRSYVPTENNIDV